LDCGGWQTDDWEGFGSTMLSTFASAQLAISGSNSEPTETDSVQSINLVLGENYKEVRISLGNSSAWKGTIKSLQLEFHGSEGDFIEVDSIRVAR
jgi:hypothetical protein